MIFTDYSRIKSALAFFFLFFLRGFSIGNGQQGISYNGLGLGVVALSRNLKLTTTLDRAITQNPCYVPFLFRV
jgi:hypothetical protein